MQILEGALEIKLDVLGKIQNMMDSWEVVHFQDPQDLQEPQHQRVEEMATVSLIGALNLISLHDLIRFLSTIQLLAETFF